MLIVAYAQTLEISNKRTEYEKNKGNPTVLDLIKNRYAFS